MTLNGEKGLLSIEPYTYADVEKVLILSFGSYEKLIRYTSLFRNYTNQVHRAKLQGYKMLCRSYRDQNRAGNSPICFFKAKMRKFASLAP